MRLSVYKNDKHEKYVTCVSITGAFTWIKEKYGTNTGMIQHNPPTQTEQEYWKIPVADGILTVINLDS